MTISKERWDEIREKQIKARLAVPADSPERDYQRVDMAEFLARDRAKEILEELDGKIGTPRLDAVGRLFHPIEVGPNGQEAMAEYLEVLPLQEDPEVEVATNQRFDGTIFGVILDGQLGFVIDYV